MDSQGNVFVAGTTNSPDYPTTPDAFEPVYIASAPPPTQICLFFCVYPPPASGYLTKLNATGTGLIYSTYYSGTQDDTITFAAFAANGIYISGTAGSPDLPGFDGYPAQCLPQAYTASLSADAEQAGAARAAPGGAILAYDAQSGTLLGWTANGLAAFDPSAPPDAVACILDAADLQPVSAIAPGELLSIFGNRLASGVAAVAPGQFPTSMGGVSVAVNGDASPLLYVSPQQVNFQVPFEIAGAAQAKIAFANTGLGIGESITLPIVASNPVAFLAPTEIGAQGPTAVCIISGLAYAGGPIPIALNADGSRNTCANPAEAGSVVRIFLAGLGVTSPPQATGAVTQSATPLNLPVAVAPGSQSSFADASAAPGEISGVWQVDMRMGGVTGAIPVSLTVGGVAVRDAELTIWVQ